MSNRPAPVRQESFPVAAKPAKNDRLASAIQSAIKQNPWIAAMRAIDRLSPPGCDPPTTAEIRLELERVGLVLNLRMVSQQLVIAKDHEYVIKGKYDLTTWWKLSRKGKEFLSEH